MSAGVVLAGRSWGPSGIDARRGTVREMPDPSGGLGHGPMQLLGPVERGADRQVGLPDGPVLEPRHLVGDLGPVEPIIVDVEVDQRSGQARSARWR